MPTIRPARPDDADFIVAANISLARETESVHLQETVLRAGVQALLESRVPGMYWIAELDGLVVGQLLITYEWSDWRNRMVWWIQSVYVSPAARRHGIFVRSTRTCAPRRSGRAPAAFASTWTRRTRVHSRCTPRSG